MNYVKGVTPTINETVRPVGSSILMKTDRNGKISLSTNKTKKTNSTPDINSTIRKELGLLSNQRKLATSKSALIRQMQRASISPAYRNTTVRSINAPNNRYPREINITEGKL